MRSFLTLSMAFLLASVSQGAIVFQLGNNPQPDEENVLFSVPDQIGNPVFGVTQTSDITVAFSSTTNAFLTNPGQGQARVQDAGTTPQTTIPIFNMTISIPGGTYQDIILNPFLDGLDGGDATVTVVSGSGGMFAYTLGNGQNFLTIFAQNDAIVSTTIDAVNGFGDLRQPRISGAELIVPEPASLAIWGLLAASGAAVAYRRCKAPRR